MGLTVAIRVDASQKTGLGHAMRMLALSKELAQLNAKIFWVTRQLPDQMASTLLSIGVELLYLSTRFTIGAPFKPYWRMDADQTIDVLTHAGPPVDLLVVDHYGLDAKWETRLRPYATRILAVDDLPDRPHDCDILIDMTAGRRPEDYDGLVPHRCTRLTGSDYALLDPQFARLRPGAAARRRRRKGAIDKVFISFGGTDRARATAKAITALSQTGFSGEVDVVLGDYAAHKAPVRRLLGRTFPKARLHIGPKSTATLMADSDLAIGATGTTTWERCTVGLPTVAISLASNQRDVARALSEAGAGVALGDVRDVTVGHLATVLGELLTDHNRVLKMSEDASIVCDGLGVMRVGLQLAPVRTKDGQPISLRRAKQDDRDLLFAWQSDPSTRRFSRNPDPPTYEEHCDWFDRKLKDPTCFLNIIMDGDIPAGVLRLDALADRDPSYHSFEISIFVDPARKRRGIAQGALRCLRRLLPWAIVYAWVHPDNTASHGLFQRAGWVQSDGWYISRPQSDPGRNCS